MRSVVVLLVLIWACGCHGYMMEKVWRSAYRFEDPEAWPGGTLPSSGDVVVLPESHAVFWPQNVLINARVLLGMSGAIVLHPSPAGTRRFFPLATMNGDDGAGAIVGHDGSAFKFPAYRTSEERLVIGMNSQTARSCFASWEYETNIKSVFSIHPAH